LKIVSLLKTLHATVKVQFEVDGVKKVIYSIMGVKQGDLLGPELFIFFMAAVKETWRLHHDFELCVVRSKNDFVERRSERREKQREQEIGRRQRRLRTRPRRAMSQGKRQQERERREWEEREVA